MRKISIFVCMFMMLTACGEKQNSDLKHDHGKIVRTKNPLAWISHSEISPETMRELLKDKGELTVENKLKNVKSWLQVWINKMDIALRLRYPEQLKDVETPRVILIDDERVNAAVFFKRECITASISYKADRIDESQKYGYLIDSDGVTAKELSEDLKCNDEIDKSILEDYLIEFNNNTNTKCEFSFGEKGEISLGGCLNPPKGDSDKIVNAKSVSVFRTIPFVLLNTGLLKEYKNKEEVLMVLAHELGHYYKAHGGAFDAEYDFFYDYEKQSSKGTRPKPTKDSELIALGEKMAKLPKAMNFYDDLSDRIEGTKISPANFHIAVNYAHHACKVADENGAKCEKSCSDVVKVGKLENLDKYFEDLGSYPYFEEHNHEFIRELDGKLISCLKKPNPELESFFPSDVHLLYEPHLLLEIYDDEYKNYLAKKLRGVEAVLNFSEKIEPLSVQELFSKVDESVIRIKKLAPKLYGEVKDKTLGWYTDEQEADEFAAELLHYMNVGLKGPMKAFGNFLKGSFGDDIKQTLSFDDCAKLMKNKGEAFGKLNWISRGDYQTSHPHSCFRAFNFYKEWEAHGYIAHLDNQMTNDFMSWKDVKDEIDNFYINKELKMGTSQGGESKTASFSFVDNLNGKKMVKKYSLRDSCGFH